MKEKLLRALRYIFKGIPTYYSTVEIKVSESRARFENRCMIVTGGGRGLGFFIAKKIVEEGGKVLITGRNEDTLKKAIEQLGTHAYYEVLDMENVEEFQHFFIRAEKVLGGKIDSLVSNAGISLHEGDFRNVTVEGWDKQFDINLKGNYFIVQAFITYLEKKEDTSGNVVVITSERAQRPDFIPYGLTKTAANSFIKAIGRKVISEGIRLNGVGPGVTASDMTGFSKEGNIYADWQPGHRIFMPEEVAEVVSFLLDDISSCIAGEIINCDHGRYIETW